MCDKAANTYSATQFVPECYKTQEMCDKAVNRRFCVWFCSRLIWGPRNVWVVSSDPFCANKLPR